MKTSNGIFNEDVECKYCGGIVDQSGSWDGKRKWCKGKYPDCIQTYKNFHTSLENCLKSENENIRITAEWIEEQLKYGIAPKYFHPLLYLVVQTKRLARQIKMARKN